MARAYTPAITPQMFRHFAVLTVAVTAVVAFFAQGENRQAVTEQVAQRQPPAAEADSPAEAAPPKLARNNPAADAGAWGEDIDFGRPTVSVSFGGSLASSASWTTDFGHGSLVDDHLRGLTAAEREELIRPLAESTGGSASEALATIAHAESASRLRSGSLGRE